MVDIVGALAGGLKTGEGIRQARERREQDRMTQELVQSLGQNFNPQQLAQLATMNPQAAAILQNMNTQQMQQRKDALTTVTRQARNLFNRNDMMGLVNLADENAQMFPDSAGLLMNAAAQGDLDSINNLISDAEARLGIDIEGERLEKREAEARVRKLEGEADQFSRGRLPSVQSSKILEDGSIIQVFKGGGRRVIDPAGGTLEGQAATDHIKNVNQANINRQKDLAQFKFDLDKKKREADALTGQQKEIAKANIQRISDLSQGTNSRIDAINKANKFKMALEKGEATSGASRRGFQFVPGVFTDQGEFDEEFNAFAEVAARQQLKASGETRPTDADVEGMKRAMFGVGRDPQVNIQLLSDFIDNQRQDQNELDALMRENKAGNLGDFIFRRELPLKDPNARTPITRRTPQRINVGRFQVEEAN